MTLPDLKADIEALKRIAEAALRCLYLEAPESVVKDVSAKVEAVFAAQAARTEALEAELASLRSEREGMREGLEPFAAVAGINERLAAGWPDNKPNSEFIPGAWPTWGDFRRARALLHQGGGE